MTHQKEVSVLVIAAPCRDLDDLALPDELPGGRDEIDDGAAKALLHLEQLLELLDSTHGIVGVSGGGGDQVQGF